MAPLFSICIPCFNHANYVGTTIDSVLRQDFTDFEIVVADNASTDGSRDVVRSFADPRIRLIENRFNIGFAPNLQQVTRHATGRYLNLLSSDDVMEPGALSTYAALIERLGAEERLLLMSQAWFIDGEGKRFSYSAKAPGHLGSIHVAMPTQEELEATPHHSLYRGRQMLGRALRAFDTVGIFCTLVYDRRLWEAVEGYNSTQQMNPDKHFGLKLLRQDPLVVWVNRPLYSYRRHLGGQAALQAKERSIRYQLDQYAYTLQFGADELKAHGLPADHLRRRFLERDVVDAAASALAQGNWRHAARLLAFGVATYPEELARVPRGWAMAGLLSSGPVASPVAKAARLAWRWMATPTTLGSLFASPDGDALEDPEVPSVPREPKNGVRQTAPQRRVKR